ncbi:hypothetical protein QS257_08040 [Terrilactibacillus sp. S3-3]|nr:hypothetical protein QS257_08040 [Terrilactibacillus sp. S3-3]
MFKKFVFPPWLKKARDGLEIIILPLGIFQLIPTIFFPNTFDVLILAVFIIIYFAFLKKLF